MSENSTFYGVTVYKLNDDFQLIKKHKCLSNILCSYDSQGVLLKVISGKYSIYSKRLIVAKKKYIFRECMGWVVEKFKQTDSLDVYCVNIVVVIIWDTGWEDDVGFLVGNDIIANLTNEHTHK